VVNVYRREGEVLGSEEGEAMENGLFCGYGEKRSRVLRSSTNV
jgi:hypothetical protein